MKVRNTLLNGDTSQKLMGVLPKKLTIASYPGGKSDTKKHDPLYRNVPNSINTIYEPFAGLANFSIITASQSKKICINDLDPNVASLLSTINDRQQLDELKEMVRSLEPIERDDYYKWKRSDPNTQLDRAVKQLVILNCSVSAAGGGYSHEKAHRKWYTNKAKHWEIIHTIFSDHQAVITNLPYTKFLHEYVPVISDFVYLDPPYHVVAKKGNLYGKGYNTVEISQLQKIVESLECNWILSNRYSQDLVEAFSGYYSLSYNTYNDMNNTKSANPELLISNFELK